MRKWTTILLLCTMLTGMCACGGAKTDTEPSDAESNTPDTVAETEPETKYNYLSALPKTSYDGFAFRILALPQDSCPGIQSFWADEPNGEIINDTVYARNLYIEEMYDISITYESQTAAVKQINTLVKANDDTYAIVSDEAKEHMSYSTQGIFSNLNAIQSIDFSMPWWYADAVDALTIAGKLYAGYSDINTQIKERVACEFVNLDMATDNGMADPYQLVFDGKWTLDTMREMAEAAARDLDSDGKLSKDDIGGYVVGIGSYNVLINGSGCPLATKNADGSVTINYGSEAFINAAEKVAALVNNPAYTVYLNDNAWGMDMFNGGGALFREGNLYIYNDLREFDSHFGVLPVPKYDETQEKYRSMMNNSSMGVSIPVSVQDPEQIGTILEALNAYSYMYLKDAYYETMLKGKLAREEQSVQMLDIITENIVVDYGVINENTWGNVISSWLSSMHTQGAGGLSSLAVQNAEKFDALYTKIVTAYESQP